MVAYVLTSLLRRRKKNRYLAIHEYWVYLDEPKLPKQDAVMDLVLTGRAIGPKEGLLFSDIRLHVGLALKTKNAHIFRPDLLDDHIEPTAQILESLAASPALAKIRYVSEEPLKDNRHVKLLPYLAYAYAKLGGGKVIYDVSAERLMTLDDLQKDLKADPEASSPATHVRVIWKTSPHGGHAETRGLIKKGLPELTTLAVEADERILITTVLEEAARSVWEEPTAPASVEVEGFGDRFRLEIGETVNGKASVRILRMQPI